MFTAVTGPGSTSIESQVGGEFVPTVELSTVALESRIGSLGMKS